MVNRHDYWCGEKILDEWYNLETGEPIAGAGEDENEAEPQARMLANIKKNSIPVIRRRNWQLPAAAILVISLSIAAYFTLHTKQTSQSKTIAAVIHPGGDNACHRCIQFAVADVFGIDAF